jgi:hypothetical protein
VHSVGEKGRVERAARERVALAREEGQIEYAVGWDGWGCQWGFDLGELGGWFAGCE